MYLVQKHIQCAHVSFKWNVKTQCHNFVQVSSESPIRQEKKADGFRRRKNPRQHLQQVQPVDIGGDAFKMWSDVGLSLGLSSDPEIATFLLQQWVDGLKLEKCDAWDIFKLFFTTKIAQNNKAKGKNKPKAVKFLIFVLFFMIHRGC